MGLLKTAGKVAVASSVHGRVQRRQQNRWAQQAAAAPAPAPMPAPAAPMPAPAAPAPAPDLDAKLSQLAKLGELRDAGILTDAEFEAKKSQILGQ